ncbi:MAG: DinB family protein [Mycobacteriales bacterium]|nr:DinB family protein [Mycobacteriales bacterium]
MAIAPDTKDWTWVVETRCDECGTDPAGFAREDVPRLLRETAARWVAFLRDGRATTVRPDDRTWAPLEYAVHVRDVVRLYDERLRLMLETDNPLYPNWDQDASAVADRYLEQDPAEVADDLEREAEVLARRFAAVTDWDRPGRRSDGARFTVDSFARYFLHDPLHHLHDVGA